MSNNGTNDEIPVPGEIRALHQELSSMRYEERPSFGPELRAELARAWVTGPEGRHPVLRHVAAAALAGLLLVAAAVPSARASLSRLLGVIESEVLVADVPPVPALEIAEPPFPRSPEPPVESSERAGLPDAPPEIVIDGEALVRGPTGRPQMLDREGAARLLEQAYPPYLQARGVGGLVRVRAWVDAHGMAGLAELASPSGVQELDRAALRAVPLLRFDPALQNGRPVGTWIEFPVLFEPDSIHAPALEPLREDALRLPDVGTADRWELEEPLDLGAVPLWFPADGASVTRAAEAALAAALGDAGISALGPIGSVLVGSAPEGRAPTAWRTRATEVLEAAIERDPSNPAPLLALGRIRLRQGLRSDARRTFETGLRIAIANETAVPPALVAELHYERGRLIQDNWQSTREVGRVRSWAFEAGRCTQAPTVGASAGGYASVERLVAWNYLCPGELERVFRAGFDLRPDDGADLSLMMASYRAAIDEVPAHPASNVALLLALGDAGRWDDVLAGARRFARRSGGHPHALLLAGLALHQLGSLEPAAEHFEAALGRLPLGDAEAIRDVFLVIDPVERADYRRLWGDERRAWEVAFWAGRDRTPGTEVNEREVQHLARSAYAHLRFGGTASDAGEVWVRFGGPNAIHIVDAGSGQLTEFWDYGSGPDITFARWVASRAMDLTPEGRAYVDDLGNIFPPQ
jgi:protein TonB